MTYILYAKRTPVGKMSGSLSTIPAPKLGAHLVEDALKEVSIKPEQVDEIIMGQVLPAGCGQAPARQAAIYGGLPTSTRALTINRVCGSGLKAVMLGDQSIQLGDAEVVFAGGQENMSLAPHLLPNSRSGYKFGNITALDHMQYDGLWDPYNNVPMGDCGEKCATKYDFSREAQDQFAKTSYTKARSAIDNGWFANEVLPVEIKSRKATKVVDTDEEPFGADLEKMSALRAAFQKDGTITAANASSINDGASLLVLAKDALTKPLARIIAHASYAHEPEWFTTAPIKCIEKVLAKAKLKTQDIDLFEINEAFSVVTMAAIEDLKLDPNKVNIHGGAVSIGHPIGASGARILTTLVHALQKTKGRYGLATLCIGGGEASAMIIERLD